MSAADDAYAAAIAEIARVKAAGKTQLNLDREPYRALTAIPPQIADIPGLDLVDLDKTQVTDLTPLRGLTGLTHLFLNQTGVTDLTPLRDLTGLTHLGLNQTGVTDLSPLRDLTGLTDLRLNQTGVTDLTPLRDLTGLTRLWLSQTGVTDLTPLQGLTGLTTLSLTQTGVTDLTVLRGLTGLTHLWLDQTGVTDLTPLRGLTGLTDLSLGGSQISDLRPIRGLANLGTDGPPALMFTNTPATAQDAELARLAEIKDNETRTRETLAYLKTLPPWPEPYTPKATPDGSPPRPIGPDIQDTTPTGQTLSRDTFKPPRGLKRLTLTDARKLLETSQPLLRQRCQTVVAEIDDALAIQTIRIPNDPELLTAHETITRTLILSKAALSGIHDALPEDFTDQPVTEADAHRLRAAIDQVLQSLKDAAAYVDRKDHTPTYGGLLRLGAATGFASVLAFVPGVNIAIAIPTVYACLYGTEAAKALKDIGKLSSGS